jgi:hypothetical protein
MSEPAAPPQETVYVRDAEGREYSATLDQVGDLVRNQGYTLSPTQPNFRGVPLRGGTGEVVEATPEEATEALRRWRGSVTTRGELAAAEERRIYDAPGAAFFAGAARGATLGASDLLSGYLDPSLPGDLRRLEQANPSASLAGELAGGVGALAATGGGSAVGRAAGAAGARVGALTSRVAAGVAQGAVEGGLIEAGRAVSRAALEERSVEAAKVASALGHGLLLGAVLGGALGAGGRAAEVAGERLSSLARASGGSFSEQLLQRLENEATAKSFGALKAQFREFNAETFGRARARVGEIAEELAFQSPERKLEAAKRLTREAWGEMDAALARVEQSGARVDTRETIGAFDRVLTDLRQRSGPDYKRASAELEQWWDAFLAKGRNGEVRATWELKSDLGKTIEWTPGREAFSSPVNQAKRDIYRALDDSVVKAAESSAVADAWRQANTNYQAAKWVRDTLREKAAANANRFFGLSEMVGAGVGTLASGGLSLGGLVGGAALGAASRLVKSYGADAATVALRALRTGSTARAAGLVDGLVDRSVRAYAATLGRASAGRAGALISAAVASGNRASREEAAKKSAAAPVAKKPREDLGKIRTRLADERRVAVAALRQAAASTSDPVVRAALQGQEKATGRAYDYLLSKIPASSNLTATVTPQAEAPRAAQAQLDELREAARVVADPLSVLDSLRTGTLSRVQVEALEATAPELLREIRGRVSAALRERKEPVPYAEALQLSRLLGVVGHPALAPNTIRTIQQIYGGTPEVAAQRTPAVRRPINRSKVWDAERNAA